MQMVIDNKGGLPYERLLFLQRVFATAQSVLGLDRVPGTVKVSLVSSSAGPRWCKKCQTYHEVSGTGGATSGVIGPNNTTEVLLIDHDNMGALVESLAHELVHVRDAVAGRLVMVEGGQLWEGRFYNDRWRNPEGALYEQAPWEVAARAGADKIMEAFVNECESTRQAA